MEPFFSICIPQHNRTSFLLEALKSAGMQTFRDLELCISDDCSTDGREQELLAFLKASGMRYVYRKLDRNSRYDANLRASIALAHGKYCLLLGNDDALASPSTLEELYADIGRSAPVGVVITNFERFDSGQRVRRIRRGGIAGSGPSVAVGNFRNLSFVSGVVLEREHAQRLATERWDGSEMYQMYVACRMIAEGATLLNLERVAIREGIKIPGEQVDSYTLRARARPCPIEERHIPLGKLGRLVADAIAPYVNGGLRRKLARRIFTQFYLFTYAFWIFEFRRVQSWHYALGICLGMRPRTVLAGVDLSAVQRAALTALYAAVTATGLVVPARVFRSAGGLLHALAKTVR